MKKTTATAGRVDAWDAGLTEAQRWQAYDQACRSKWYEVASWAKEEFKLSRAPGRNAVYAWKARMRGNESAHRVEESVRARDEIGALAGTAAADAKLIGAYKSMAADLALRGNAGDAVKFTLMAMDLASGQRKAEELELKARAQATKDAALKLAREKFEAAENRLTAARDAIARLDQSGGITPEARAEIEKAMGLL